jgi:hypothetical protein
VTSALPRELSNAADFSRNSIEARIQAGYDDALRQGIGRVNSPGLRPETTSPGPAADTAEPTETRERGAAAIDPLCPSTRRAALRRGLGHVFVRPTAVASRLGSGCVDRASRGTPDPHTARAAGGRPQGSPKSPFPQVGPMCCRRWTPMDDHERQGLATIVAPPRSRVIDVLTRRTTTTEGRRGWVRRSVLWRGQCDVQDTSNQWTESS